MDDLIAEQLQSCLDQMASGASLDECLAHYPGTRGELEPLLGVMLRVRSLPRTPLPGAARAAIQARMIGAVRSLPPPPPLASFPMIFMLVFGAIAAVILVAIILLGLALFWPRTVRPAPPPPVTRSATATVVRPTMTSVATLQPTSAPGEIISPRPTLPPATETPEQLGRQPTALPQPTQAPPPPAAPGAPDSPGSPDSPDQSCQGHQYGRDDKTCDRDKNDDKGDDGGDRGKGKDG